MVGSALIVADVARDPKKRKQTYSRIMMAMSCFDCVTSFMFALSTWPIPAGSGSLWAAGTTGTCTLQGFFIQLSLAAPLYNLCLAVHYLLVIKYGWSDVRLAKAERRAHPVIVAVAIGIAVAGLPLEMFNNATIWCWIAPNERMDHPKHATMYRWVFYYAELWIIIVVVSAIMILVVADVTRTEKRSSAFSANSANKRKMSMAAMVKRQAFYYVSAFYITWTFPTTLRILQTVEVPVPYAIYLCAVIFTPLQGFLNYLIYMRPRFLRWRRKREAKRRRAALASPAGATPANDPEEDAHVDAEVALAEANRASEEKEEEQEEEKEEEKEEGSS